METIQESIQRMEDIADMLCCKYLDPQSPEYDATRAEAHQKQYDELILKIQRVKASSSGKKSVETLI